MDINIFENGFNIVNSYIFGWIMSDGCLRREGRNKTAWGVRITSKDYKIIHWIHSILCKGNKIYSEGKYYQIKYRNQDGIEFLIKNGLIERKSLTVKMPSLPSECFHAFLRGYFDGNGSIILHQTKHNMYGQVSITSGSVDLLSELKKILHGYGIESHVYLDGRKNNKAVYLRVTKRKDIERFYQLIYQDENCPCLERKLSKFKKLMEAKPKNNIA